MTPSAASPGSRTSTPRSAPGGAGGDAGGVRGELPRRRSCALALAIFIDATDGWLARALRVKERLPFFDGGRLDDIVDYLTYVFVPVLLMLRGRTCCRPRWELASAPSC